jgi:rare lipoprotein A
LGKGSSELQVERLLPDEIERIAANRNNRSQLELASLSNSGSPPVVSVPAVSQATPDDIAERNAILAGFSDDQKNPAEMPGENAKATAPPQVSATFADSNFYLQLGAFGDAANAEAAQIRLRQSMPAGFPSIEIVQSGILYRLYCGPFLSRNKAAEAAQQLDNGASAKALIVQR